MASQIACGGSTNQRRQILERGVLHQGTAVAAEEVEIASFFSIVSNKFYGG